MVSNVGTSTAFGLFLIGLTVLVADAASTVDRRPLTTGSCVASGLCCQQKNNSCRAFAVQTFHENDINEVDGKTVEGAVDTKADKEQEDRGCFCDTACVELGDCCSDYRQACEPVDCELAEDWDEWSECDVRCGPGMKTRKRRVVRQPMNGGKQCGTTIERASCEGANCKVPRGAHGIEEMRETAYIIPGIFKSWRTSKRLGYNPFGDIRKNIFEHYDGKSVVRRPPYCMMFEVTNVRGACNFTNPTVDAAMVLAAPDVEVSDATRPRLVKGLTICVECESAAMKKKLGGRCRGQGVMMKETRWNAVTVPGCRGRWVLKSREDECSCSAAGQNSFTLV